MNAFSRTIIDQMLCDASKYTASMEYDARSHRNFDLLCWAADCKKAADDLMYEHFSTLEVSDG